jgi:hypothetical protein
LIYFVRQTPTFCGAQGEPQFETNSFSFFSIVKSSLLFRSISNFIERNKLTHFFLSLSITHQFPSTLSNSNSHNFTTLSSTFHYILSFSHFMLFKITCSLFSLHIFNKNSLINWYASLSNYKKNAGMKIKCKIKFIFLLHYIFLS